MDRKLVLDRTVRIFADVMDVDPATVSAETTADDVESWDSISHVRLIMSIESAFGANFTNAEIGGFQRLGDIADTMAAKLS